MVNIFQKNDYFGGCGGFEDIFAGSSQDWTIWGSLLCNLESFLKVKVQN